VEHAGLGVCSKEGGYIAVVGEGSGKTDDAYGVSSVLLATDGTCNDALEDRSTVIVQQVDLIDTDETDEIGVAGVVSRE
jgi:hypothetical protein